MNSCSRKATIKLEKRRKPDQTPAQDQELRLKPQLSLRSSREKIPEFQKNEK